MKLTRCFSWFIFATFTLVNAQALAGFGPSKEVLAADIKTVQEKIKSVGTEIEKYKGGMILNMLQMRREILKNTEAMLEQKRSSLLRMISLKYTIDGKPFQKITNAQIDALKTDISKSEKKITAQKKEASRYSGGLILLMKLSAIETEGVTLASLRMRYLTAKHGIPIFGVPDLDKSSSKKSAPKNVVKDKDAL